MVREINSKKAIPGVAAGKRGFVYDVILQPGHYGRVAGATGTTGSLVSEQSLVAYIVGKVAQALAQRPITVLVITADDYLKPIQTGTGQDLLRAKAFLAVHADGTSPPCKGKPSLGYQGQSSVFAMHAIGLALAQSLGYAYDEFHKDNFTANEAHYYTFNAIQTGTLKGILEIGELTCPGTERRLIVNADLIAANIARALEFVSTLEQSTIR